MLRTGGYAAAGVAWPATEAENGQNRQDGGSGPNGSAGIDAQRQDPRRRAGSQITAAQTASVDGTNAGPMCSAPWLVLRSVFSAPWSLALSHWVQTCKMLFQESKCKHFLQEGLKNKKFGVSASWFRKLQCSPTTKRSLPKFGTNLL